MIQVIWEIARQRRRTLATILVLLLFNIAVLVFLKACLVGLSPLFVACMFFHDPSFHFTAFDILFVILDFFVMLTGQDGLLEIINGLPEIELQFFGQGITSVNPGLIDRSDL